MTDVVQLLESRRWRLGRWAVAAAVVGALHAGGVGLALINWQKEDASDVAAGAMVVNLAPLPAAVPVDSPYLAHGPSQQEAKLTPDASKQAVEEVEKDIPPVDPSPAPEPEVALPKPQPKEEEKPKEERPQEAVLDQPQQDRDTIAMAPPRVNAQAAPASMPSPGQSATLALRASWNKSVSRHLERFRHYPAAARGLGQHGTAVVHLRIDRSGHVISSHILKGAGASLLDQGALAWLKRASPFPAPPDQMSDAELEFDARFSFVLK